MFKIMLNFVFREYGNAVAEITASYNLFLECNEAENSNVRAYAKEMLSEAELLHTKYTKFNVRQYCKMASIYFCRIA